MKMGNVFRVARKMQKLTQTQVAQKCFVVDAVISNYENDKSIPDLDVLCPLCNALNVSLGELKNGKYVQGGSKVLPPVEFNAKILADTLKELRVCAGLSQTDEAAQIFVTSQTVSKWETGATVPSFETLCAIADLYAVDVTTFFSGLHRETDVLDDTSQKFVFQKRSVRLTRATVILSAFLALFMVASVVLGVLFAGRDKQLNTALSNVDKLEAQVSATEEEKNNAHKQILNLQNSESNLQNQLQTLNEQYQSSVLENQDFANQLALSKRDVCRLTLNTPSGQTEEYFVLVGVTTTITPKDQTAEKDFCKYYVNGDTNDVAYNCDSFSICPSDKNDIFLEAVVKARFVDFSLAQSEEETALFSNIEKQLCDIDEKYVAQTLADAFYDMITHDTRDIRSWHNILTSVRSDVKNSDNCYLSDVGHRINKIVEEISDVESLKDLRDFLLVAVEKSDAVVVSFQTYYVDWTSQNDYYLADTKEEQQAWYIENALEPYCKTHAKQFVDFITYFNKTDSVDGLDRYFAKMQNNTLFYDLNIYDWMSQNGYLELQM